MVAYGPETLTTEAHVRGLEAVPQPARGAATRASTSVTDRTGAGGAVVLVGTYPPTACGLATFTSNLRAAISPPGSPWRADVVQVVDDLELRRPRSGGEVVARWLKGDGASLRRVLSAVAPYDAVLLQHEYGLYAGADGEEVLELVDGLEPPLVAVVHTALLRPSPNQRRVLDRIMAAASVVVVQSRAARDRLLAVHGVEPARIAVIPHGATANFGDSGTEGDNLPARSAPTVLTWGLLGPGKGIEHAIGAVAILRRRGFVVDYVVAGQTHPKVQAKSGERYRHRLVSLAAELGVGDRVSFDDAYRDWGELRSLVRGADVVLLPYDSTDQVSSGVLVEAIASAKPVVATRFPHAVELLSHGAGITVPHRDSAAMADALELVLGDPETAARMRAAARREAEPLLWPAVGAAYRSLVGALTRARRAG